MTDTIIEKYVDEEDNEITVVKDKDGKIFHCWELNLPVEVISFIKEEAKKEGIEDWEVINKILGAYLENDER